MVSFVDDRLPDQVERGANGGPRFNTTVLTLSGGDEQRNINWSQSRARYDIGYGIQTKEDFQDILDFFFVRQGRAIGFRFKDWADFQIPAAGSTAISQQIGLGDGSNTTFQIIRTYTVNATSFNRIIKKPVAGTVAVYVNNVLQSSGFTVDNNTGIITFTVAPTSGAIVGVACEFDVPVRFDSDSLDIALETFEAGAIPSIPVIEVRR